MFKGVRKVKLEYIFYILICSIALFSCFMSPIYSWDLDHEMYFGSRLLRGELIWTQEFHDKLPFVPFLFVVPAYFKSVLAFKIVSIFFISLASFCLFFFMPKVFKKNNSLKDQELFCSIAYFIILYFTYDSIETINCIAVSCYLIAFVAMLYINTSCEQKYKINYLVLGSCFSAAAISIRPYFFPALGVTILFSLFLKKEETAVSLKRGSYLFAWVFAIGVWGVILNILPYIVTGQISAFWDGLSLLKDHINPLSAPHDFFKSMRKFPDIIMWGSWFFMACYMGKHYYSNRGIREQVEFKVFLISCVSTLSMVFYILCEHYWRHYIQFFVANYCLCLFSFMSIFKASSSLLMPYFQNKKIFLGFLVSVIIILCFDLKKEIHLSNKIQLSDVSYSYSTSNYWKENLFSDYMKKENIQNGVSFFFPDDMKAHWLLGEGRHHFPHSANTQQIFLGWWKNVSVKSSHFLIPTNGNEYCKLISSNGADLIIVQPNSLLLPCLTDLYNGYKLQDTLEKPIGKILVFKRLARP